MRAHPTVTHPPCDQPTDGDAAQQHQLVWEVPCLLALERQGPTRPPHLDLHPGEQFHSKPPRLELRLIAGYEPRGATVPWTLVNRQGGRSRSLRQARLFTFDQPGVRAARLAGRTLRDVYAPEQVPFIARVVVSGPLGRPVEVVEAWRLEGRPEPQDLGPYPFE